MLPDYWMNASQDLAEADPLMAELVERYAGTTLSSRGDPFMTLARSIVGQQISVKAADAVWGRFVAQVGEVTPERLLQLGATGLAGCGLSQRKTEYLGDLAAHFADGRLDPAGWGM